MSNTGADLAATPRLYVGFGHGTTNMIGDATTDHFVGFRTIQTTWTWQAPSTSYTTSSGSIFSVVKIGASLTQGALAINNTQTCQFGAGAAAATADRMLLFLTLTKGSPNYTFNGFFHNSTTNSDQSNAQFLTAMIQDPPVVAQHQVGTDRTQAVDEATNGILDTVQIYWNRTDAVFEICDLAVALLA